MKPKILEIACFNLESALIAQTAGADRIELCVDYNAGGFSPDVVQVLQARKQLQIPLQVMVRPNPDLFPAYLTGDPAHFEYSEMEVQWMIQYVIACRSANVDGIVFGALTSQKEIDTTVCARLIEAAGSMSLTFHRAIDLCKDLPSNLKQLSSLGFHRVLTSGGEANALAGLSTLISLQTELENDLIIMPGGGIRSTNIAQFMEAGFSEIHSAAYNSSTKLADADEIKKLKKFVI